METENISKIIINKRHRKELGDLWPLASSIENIGLLHPVVIAPDKTLIVGQRRLEAYKLLGKTEIPVNVARDFSDVQKLLAAERDENTCRKDFLPTEAVSIGESIAAAFKPVAEKAKREHGGTAPGKKSLRGNSPKCSKPKVDEKSRTTAVAATAVGMDRRTYEKAKEVIKSGDKTLIAEMDRTGKVSGAHKKLKVKKQAAALTSEPQPLPKGPFRVIVIDPPWQYEKRPDDPSHRGACPYPTMTNDDIAALPIADLSASDSILWLWTTNAFLPDTFFIVDAWGFKYKTLLTWVKDRMGTGDWLRGKTEHCLMCVKGKPTITLTNQTTALEGKMLKHSQKPDEFYLMVEKLCPGSKVEIFSRVNRQGWHHYGDETGTL